MVERLAESCHFFFECQVIQLRFRPCLYLNKYYDKFFGTFLFVSGCMAYARIAHIQFSGQEQ